MLLAAMMKSISEITLTSELVQVLPVSAAGKAVVEKVLVILLVVVEAAAGEAKVL
jgi:hypothetical protein